MIDHHCLVAVLLFLLSDVIEFFTIFISNNTRDHFTYAKLVSLDPDFIRMEWEWMRNYQHIGMAHEIINAIAWFVFAIPSMFLLIV
jgi:hypothetical protein